MVAIPPESGPDVTLPDDSRSASGSALGRAGLGGTVPGSGSAATGTVAGRVGRKVEADS